MGTGQEVQFILTGTDIAQLQRIAESITLEMSGTPGFVDIDTDLATGKPEVRVHIDREKAEDLGVDVMNIASTINMLISGERAVTKFKEGGEQYDVKMRLVGEYRDTPNDILRLMARAGDGSLVDLATLARIETATGPSQINHYAKQREVTILANIEGIPLGTGVQLVDEIAEDRLEPGVTSVWGGMADIMRESFGYLFFALILAIILIYMILASQFEHFIHPLVIMFSLPLAMIGAFPMLLIRGHTISIMSFIGIITLMGLVTKNSILLVDFTNQEKARGTATDDALLVAGPIRLRPILMTALSTMGGLIPAFIGYGSGGEFRSPMASAVIGGLITSTFLTLLVVPVVYSLFDSWLHWFFRKIGKERPRGGVAVHGG
jgi:HAE1 family hydrophobic/amphiphilic exporter-1